MTAFTIEALAAHRQAMVAEGNYRLDGPVFADTNGGWLRKSNVLRRSFCPILEKADCPESGPAARPRIYRAAGVLAPSRR